MFAEVGMGGDYGQLDEVTADYLHDHVPSGDFVGWLARTPDGEPIASAGLSIYTLSPKPINLTGQYGYVSSFYTVEPHRGKGIAKRLVKDLVACAKEIGLPALRLHASEAGRPIYEQQGFKALNEMGLTLQGE